MSESQFEEWVAKAEEDFLAASTLDPDLLASVVCFHCQQSAEKYLKAALARCGAPTHRTHNLIVLNDIVAERDQEFASLYDELSILNPYSVVVRYPGVEVTPQDAQQALQAASRLRERIRRLLDLEQGT